MTELKETLMARIKGLVNRPKEESILKRKGFHPTGKEPGLQSIDGRQGIHFREGTVPHPTKKNHMDGGTAELYSGNSAVILDQLTNTAVVKSPNLIMFGKNVTIAAADLSKLSIQGKTINPIIFGQTGIDDSPSILVPTDFFSVDIPQTKFVMGPSDPELGQVSVSLFDMFELPSTFLPAEPDDTAQVYLTILKDWVATL